MSLASAVRTRFVAAEPPHEPEPFDDDPFAPVYDYRPLGYYHGGLEAIRSPRHPGPIVFGPPGADPNRALTPDYTRWCPCGAGWSGGGACWNCGRAATGC